MSVLSQNKIRHEKPLCRYLPPSKCSVCVVREVGLTLVQLVGGEGGFELLHSRCVWGELGAEDPTSFS